MPRARFLALLATLAMDCAAAAGDGVLVDARDGRRYATLAVDGVVWMAANLAHPTPESWCFDDQAECDADGRVYTWSAALAACPAGWRLATDEDWIGLETAMGMSPAQTHTQGARGSNEGARLRAGGDSGFDAPISGYRRPDGSYARRDERAAFWTASGYNDEDAWHRDIRADVGTVYRSPVTKTYALSVRCVRTGR